MRDSSSPAAGAEEASPKSRNWWPFAALGCLALPFLLLGGCTAVVLGLSATIWDDGGEPAIIREVEPAGVVRVEQLMEKGYGTDDGYSENFFLFYRSPKPFSQIQREYTDAMTERGYVAEVSDWWDGSGRNIKFQKEGEVGWCFHLGSYPFGMRLYMHQDYRPKQLEALPSEEYAYIVSYSVGHRWFRTTASC